MSYSDVSGHRPMVFDEYRNGFYAQAIRRLVNADSVVLDLGAGLGVLGLIAAAAGAKRVYLVEPQPLVHIAKEIAQRSGYGDNIVVLQGTIEQLELPEPVDLIVSVFTGNLLFSEDLLPSLFYARDRWLKPGGHLVPDQAELLVAPVNMAQFVAEQIAVWSTPNLGLDFSPARRFAVNELYGLRREQLLAQRLSEPLALARLDFARAKHADCNTKGQVEITSPGDCHGLLGWIRIKLGDNWLSTAPDGPAVHWSPTLLPCDPPLPLEIGEALEIAIDRPEAGDWTWTLGTPTAQRRHSTFLGRPQGLKQCQLLAPSNRPQRNPQGDAALLALQLMQGDHSNEAIAQQLAARYPNEFPTLRHALLFVGKILRRYGM